MRTAVNPTMTTSTTPVPETSTTQASEGIPKLNTTNASRVPPMVCINDKGLEEQFLTGDKASQEVMDITANRVTIPVDMEDDAAPLNPIYTQRSQQDEDLDLQPSRGPRDESMNEAIDDFLDENYEDVLCTLNIQTNFLVFLEATETSEEN